MESRELKGFKLRLATDDDGPAIERIVRASGFDVDADWTGLHPFWLVAESKNGIGGTLQVCPGRPMGRLEFLCLERSLAPHRRYCAMVLLMLAGLETLRRGGSQFASGMVPFENKVVKRKYKKHGATVIGTGNMMAVRL